MLKKIFALDAGKIPSELEDICLQIDDDFPLHYNSGIVLLEDDGNAFCEWLKVHGFTFNNKGYNGAPDYDWLAVWGT